MNPNKLPNGRQITVCLLLSLCSYLTCTAQKGKLKSTASLSPSTTTVKARPEAVRQTVNQVSYTAPSANYSSESSVTLPSLPTPTRSSTATVSSGRMSTSMPTISHRPPTVASVPVHSSTTSTATSTTRSVAPPSPVSLQSHTRPTYQPKTQAVVPFSQVPKSEMSPRLQAIVGSDDDVDRDAEIAKMMRTIEAGGTVGLSPSEAVMPVDEALPVPPDISFLNVQGETLEPVPYGAFSWSVAKPNPEVVRPESPAPVREPIPFNNYWCPAGEDSWDGALVCINQGFAALSSMVYVSDSWQQPFLYDNVMAQIDEVEACIMDAGTRYNVSKYWKYLNCIRQGIPARDAVRECPAPAGGRATRAYERYECYFAAKARMIFDVLPDVHPGEAAVVAAAFAVPKGCSYLETVRAFNPVDVQNQLQEALALYPQLGLSSDVSRLVILFENYERSAFIDLLAEQLEQDVRQLNQMVYGTESARNLKRNIGDAATAALTMVPGHPRFETIRQRLTY